MEGPLQGRATKLLNMSRHQLSVVIGLLIGEHLPCECESLTMSWSCIFGQSFGELQQLSHVPVDLFRRFAIEIELAGK